jgi:hypothetical protein
MKEETQEFIPRWRSKTFPTGASFDKWLEKHIGCINYYTIKLAAAGNEMGCGYLWVMYWQFAEPASVPIKEEEAPPEIKPSK